MCRKFKILSTKTIQEDEKKNINPDHAVSYQAYK